jgi:hypothetical protein
MIRTITETDPIEFDARVNQFERETTYKSGVSRVFATQTHVLRNEGMSTLYVAVIFYKGDTQ